METTTKTIEQPVTSAAESAPVRTSNPALTKYIGITIGSIVIAAAGFVSGMQFQKTVGTSSASSSMSQGMNGAMGGRMGQMGSFGTVTAISGSSITVNDTRMNTTKTYSVDSSTTVTSNGSSASLSDIKTGDTVMVQTTSSSSTVASTILLNPTMGGSMGGPTAQTQSSTNTSTAISSGSTT